VGEEKMTENDKRSNQETALQQLTQDAVMKMPRGVGDMPCVGLVVDAGCAVRLGFAVVAVNVKSCGHHRWHKDQQQQPRIKLSLQFLSHIGGKGMENVCVLRPRDESFCAFSLFFSFHSFIFHSFIFHFSF